MKIFINENSYIDEPTKLIIEGLAPKVNYKLELETLDENQVKWKSSKEINSSDEGIINTNIDKLLSLLIPDENSSDECIGPVFAKDLLKQDYKVIVIFNSEVLAEKYFFKKHYDLNEVELIEVDEQNIKGRIYLPKHGHEKMPVVIFVPGSEGNIPEDRSSVFSHHGIITFAIGYHNYKDLPKDLLEIPVETIKNAYGFILRQKHVDTERIFLYGGSKWGELALLAASLLKIKFAGVIAIAPSSVVWTGWSWNGSNLNDTVERISRERISSWSFDKKPIPALSYEYTKTFFDKPPFSHVTSYEKPYRNNKDKESVKIKVEEIESSILLFTGKDDQIWPSSLMAIDIMERLRSFQFKYPYKHYDFNNCGHKFLVPNTPVWTKNPSGMLTGGTPEGNDHAARIYWNLLIDFVLNSSI